MTVTQWDETFVVLLMRDTGEREIKNKASFRSFQKIKERVLTSITTRYAKPEQIFL